MHSLDPEGVKLFEDLIRHEVEDKAFPSISYALVDVDGLVAEGHVQHKGQSQPLREDSCFRIASITKTFTALSVMQLVENGLLDLDEDVATYLPGFHPKNPFAGHESGPHGATITLRKLMSHTAGLVREPKSGHYLDATRPALADTVAEIAQSTLKQDPSLGAMLYSNAGIAVVGYIIEKVSGQRFPDYVTENILEPLGMIHSVCGDAPGVRDRLAPANMWTLEGDIPAPVFDLEGSPSGMVVSTSGDMARYVQCLLRGGHLPDGKRLISPAALSEMWTPVGLRMAHGKPIGGYGLCYGIGNVDGWPSVGHGGAIYGYASQMVVLPTAGLGALIFATLDSTNQIGGRLARDGLRIALARRKMGQMPEIYEEPAAVDREQLTTLPGAYRNADTGEVVEICARENRLYLLGDGVPLQIRPTGGNDYIIDGRIYGRGSDYPHLALSFSADRSLVWKDATWARIDTVPDETPPANLAPYLGEYGPDFSVTYLSYRHGMLKCLIEHFYTHDCLPDGEGTYKMRGLLYDNETLEVGARDEQGRAGIRVGQMFLVRRQRIPVAPARTDSSRQFGG